MNIGSEKTLLLNASNMDAFPVYPYAFIQVPAVARLAGIEVICRDLLGIEEGRWAQNIQTLVERHNPTMILVTLRNTDSMIAQDYERKAPKAGSGSTYFPIIQSKKLIAAIRAVSDLKIAVGGFGFSLLPAEIMHYLRPDIGVFGGPDAFFAHFEDIKSGNLEEIANLLFFQGDQLISNPRIFYPPLEEPEYTPQVIEEMMAFYQSFSSPGFDGAPIEIIRGCNHSCVFCAEPHVVGKQVRYRDLSAVMTDIETLVRHGITKLYMISSELNPTGNEFILQLANMIHSFNKKQPKERKVTWFGANYLLNFSTDEYERLHQSGFTGGWFDITALDDENAHAMRTPYRNSRLFTDLRVYARYESKRLRWLQTHEESQPDKIDGEDNSGSNEIAVSWSLFLGNPATTTKTIRDTLWAVNRQGLAQLFDSCHINSNIRVFDYEKPDAATAAVTYSVTSNLDRTGYQQILPSFAYSPALLQDFGSEEEIVLMFDHIAETYLSTKYQKSRDWHNFITQNATAASIASWTAEMPATNRVRVLAHFKATMKGRAPTELERLFLEEPQDKDSHTNQNLAKHVVDSLLAVCLEMFPDIVGSLGLPTTVERLERMNPYELAVAVFKRWSTEMEILAELSEQTSSYLSEAMQEFLRFCVQAMLYKFNVLINPKYQRLFLAIELKGSELGKQNRSRSAVR